MSESELGREFSEVGTQREGVLEMRLLITVAIEIVGATTCN